MDDTGPRKDLDTWDIALVVIMIEGELQSMCRTVPQNLTVDMQVGRKTFVLTNPQARLVGRGNTEHFGHHFNICPLFQERNDHVMRGVIVL